MTRRTDGYITTTADTEQWKYSNATSGTGPVTDVTAAASARVALPVQAGASTKGVATVIDPTSSESYDAAPSHPTELYISWAGVSPTALNQIVVIWSRPIRLLNPAGISVDGASYTQNGISIAGRRMLINMAEPCAIDDSNRFTLTIESGAVMTIANPGDAYSGAEVPEQVQPGEVAGGFIQTAAEAGKLPSLVPKLTEQSVEVDLSSTPVFNAPISNLSIPVVAPFELVPLYVQCGSQFACPIWLACLTVHGATAPLEVFSLDKLKEINPDNMPQTYTGLLMQDAICCQEVEITIVAAAGPVVSIYGKLDESGNLPAFAGQPVRFTYRANTKCGACETKLETDAAECWVQEDITKPYRRNLPVYSFDEIGLSEKLIPRFSYGTEPTVFIIEKHESAVVVASNWTASTTEVYVAATTQTINVVTDVATQEHTFTARRTGTTEETVYSIATESETLLKDITPNITAAIVSIAESTTAIPSITVKDSGTLVTSVTPVVDTEAVYVKSVTTASIPATFTEVPQSVVGSISTTGANFWRDADLTHTDVSNITASGHTQSVILTLASETIQIAESVAVATTSIPVYSASATNVVSSVSTTGTAVVESISLTTQLIPIPGAIGTTAAVTSVTTAPADVVVGVTGVTGPISIPTIVASPEARVVTAVTTTGVSVVTEVNPGTVSVPVTFTTTTIAHAVVDPLLESEIVIGVTPTVGDPGGSLTPVISSIAVTSTASVTVTTTPVTPTTTSITPLIANGTIAAPVTGFSTIELTVCDSGGNQTTITVLVLPPGNSLSAEVPAYTAGTAVSVVTATGVPASVVTDVTPKTVVQTATWTETVAVDAINNVVLAVDVATTMTPQIAMTNSAVVLTAVASTHEVLRIGTLPLTNTTTVIQTATATSSSLSTLLTIGSTEAIALVDVTLTTTASLIVSNIATTAVLASVGGSSDTVTVVTGVTTVPVNVVANASAVTTAATVLTETGTTPVVTAVLGLLMTGKQVVTGVATSTEAYLLTEWSDTPVSVVTDVTGVVSTAVKSVVATPKSFSVYVPSATTMSVVVGVTTAMESVCRSVSFGTTAVTVIDSFVDDDIAVVTKVTPTTTPVVKSITKLPKAVELSEITSTTREVPVLDFGSVIGVAVGGVTKQTYENVPTSFTTAAALVNLQFSTQEFINTTFVTGVKNVYTITNVEEELALFIDLDPDPDITVIQRVPNSCGAPINLVGRDNQILQKTITSWAPPSCCANTFPSPSISTEPVENIDCSDIWLLRPEFVDKPAGTEEVCPCYDGTGELACSEPRDTTSQGSGDPYAVCSIRVFRAQRNWALYCS